MNNKVILALLLLINLGNPVVNGMEYVKNSYSIQAHNPILRSLDDFNHLLCNRSAQDIYSFSIVNSGTLVFGNMFLDNSFKEIYDFEIHNDSVFFCGTKVMENGSEISILGYFDLATFPYSTVEVVKMPWIKKIYKLEVAAMGNRTHVVMVGENLQSNGIVVDAIYYPTYWEVNYTTTENTTAIFEDVAITDEYVVATSGYIGQPEPFYYGRLWYFKKPSTSGASLFPQTAQYINTGYMVMPPFLIDKHRGDTVVVAARCGAWTIFSNYKQNYCYQTKWVSPHRVRAPVA